MAVDTSTLHITALGYFRRACARVSSCSSIAPCFAKIVSLGKTSLFEVTVSSCAALTFSGSAILRRVEEAVERGRRGLVISQTMRCYCRIFVLSPALSSPPPPPDNLAWILEMRGGAVSGVHGSPSRDGRSARAQPRTLKKGRIPRSPWCSLTLVLSGQTPLVQHQLFCASICIRSDGSSSFDLAPPPPERGE